MRTKNLIFFSFLIAVLLLILPSVNAQNKTDANGKKQGKWMKRKDGVKFYEGQFMDDIPIGEFKYYYPNGLLKISTRFDQKGKLNRTKIYFNSYEQKVQAEGNYLDKKKDSTWNYYNEGGYIIAIENYKKGLKDGDFKVFGATGNLNRMQYFENDTLVNVSVEYFEDGTEFRSISYHKGKRNGLFKLNYPEGGILLKGNYLQDLRDSIWTTYTVSGEVEFLDYYEDGLIKKRTDKNGNKLDINTEDEMKPLNVDPSVFDPEAVKR